LALLPACDSNVSITDKSPVGPLERETASNGRITIPALHLSFRLPASFKVGEHPKLSFIARSADPPGVFSIAREMPSVVNHEPEGDESVRPAKIEGVEAMIVNDAVLEGLPAGIVARELLVANGDASFSAILSSTRSEQPRLWDRFIGSVRIESL
jgi:hypothetical protein